MVSDTETVKGLEYDAGVVVEPALIWSTFLPQLKPEQWDLICILDLSFPSEARSERAFRAIRNLTDAGVRV